MHYLFIWFIPLHTKDFYLIVNLIDVILMAFFNGYLNRFFYYRTQWTRDMHQTLLVIFLIMAIVALVVFFTQNTYRHVVHKIYMLVRLFVTLMSFIMVFYALFDILMSSDSRDKVEHVMSWLGYGCFNLLNLYWSLELVRIIN